MFWAFDLQQAILLGFPMNFDSHKMCDLFDLQ